MTKNEWPNYLEIAEQKVGLFKPDENGEATRFKALAARIDMLEERCAGINAFRGEGE